MLHEETKGKGKRTHQKLEFGKDYGATKSDLSIIKHEIMVELANVQVTIAGVDLKISQAKYDLMMVLATKAEMRILIGGLYLLVIAGLGLLTYLGLGGK